MMTTLEQQIRIEAHKVLREHRDEIRRRTGDQTYAGWIPGIGDEDSLENALRL